LLRRSVGLPGDQSPRTVNLDGRMQWAGPFRPDPTISTRPRKRRLDATVGTDHKHVHLIAAAAAAAKHDPPPAAPPGTIGNGQRASTVLTCTRPFYSSNPPTCLPGSESSGQSTIVEPRKLAETGAASVEILACASTCFAQIRAQQRC
jgi:hypothetical protein